MSPLFKKLNLTDQSVIHVLNAPTSFAEELSSLSDRTVRLELPSKVVVTFVIAFAVTQKELDELSRAIVASAEGDAIVWIAYPKGTSRKYQCEFNRDSGWSVLKAASFDTVRQVAIDEDWSALRFRRVEFIKTITRSKSMALSPEAKRRAGKP